ncbi:hypothetical protein SNEBB_006319 [Seison nebaliae]|nr:hypothetical protein SNEBB_006319 [Seison nebaliae]
MAFPTLPSYRELCHIHSSHQALARKQDVLIRKKEELKENAKFFRKSNNISRLNERWTSDNIFNSSINSYNRQFVDDKKKEKIEERRLKLTELYSEEMKEYEAQLLTVPDELRPHRLKHRVEQMKRIKEEKRQMDVEERLERAKREVDAEYRARQQSDERKRLVKEWNEQCRSREQNEQKEKTVEMNEEKKLLEKDRKLKEEEDRQKKEKHLRKNEELKRQLEDERFRQREREERKVMFLKEEAKLREESRQLEVLESQQKFEEQRRKQSEYASQLKRHHLARLRRNALEVERQLESDLSFLQQLSDMELRENERLREKKKNERQLLVHAREVLIAQRHEEKLRLAEIDAMHQHEAEKEWEKREAIWNKEREARERLLQNVLMERQEQINNKLKLINENIGQSSSSSLNNEDQQFEMNQQQQQQQQQYYYNNNNKMNNKYYHQNNNMNNNNNNNLSLEKRDSFHSYRSDAETESSFKSARQNKHLDISNFSSTLTTPRYGRRKVVWD